MTSFDIDSLRLLPDWKLQQDYRSLGENFYSNEHAQHFLAPQLILFNEALAKELGIIGERTDWSSAAWASVLSGQALLPGSQPLAQAYAGHQFGQFNKLGDGRALLLGEGLDLQQQLYDIQLKGSGPTAWSRRGDGKATLKAMLREYLISEAIHALGIPTSRSLAVVATGQPVFRETALPGGVLTRIAQSHLRVGTVEYASHLLNPQALEQLVHYTIKRHYPELEDAHHPALALLETVIQQQINLVVEWMGVGFIHGVMNTDNMSLAGITIDYGPCAFMNAYSPATVFSSIDTQGRYAFGNQPYITQWNLACLASALLPLLAEEKQKALELAQDAINQIPARYEQQWLVKMRSKLGLPGMEPQDAALIHDFLAIMEKEGRDYTNTFLLLTGIPVPEQPASDVLSQWMITWKERRGTSLDILEATTKEMIKSNPVYIPRNHRVEEALTDAADFGNWNKWMNLTEVLQNPFAYKEDKSALMLPPEGGDGDYCTYCGT
jgi:uncharacterized protein YdiU (UPF0061 family)